MREEILKKLQFYRTAPTGAAQWIEDHICAFITDFNTGQGRWCPIRSLPDVKHMDTGRSYMDFWQWQRENVIIPATQRDSNGFLKYHTVVMILPRGEAKTFISCCLLLWRFFVFPKQAIVLGANSSAQSRWSLFETMTAMVANSPILSMIMKNNGALLDKAIELYDSDGNVMSSIRSISTSTGVLSNLDVAAFSELFQQAPAGKYYYELDSSRRNIPNSWMVVDSTVSEKEHILYRLYKAGVTGEDPGIFVLYEYSEDGRSEDYHHPLNTQAQLDSFRAKFTPLEFRKFFLNSWEAGTDRVFSVGQVRAIGHIGYGGVLGRQQDIINTCTRLDKLERDDLGFNKTLQQDLASQLMSIPYSLSLNGHPRLIESREVSNLSDIYKTKWAVCIGLDMADALKSDLTLGARSILTVVLKGLPGSCIDPDLHLRLGDSVKYIYLLAGLFHITSNEIDDVQMRLDEIYGLFGGISVVCAERYGAERLRIWCEDNVVPLELISPTYDRQRAAFSELYTLISLGRFKAPSIMVPGSVGDDVLREELGMFVYDPVKKWYGSPQKKSNHGVQDDSVYSLGWGIYGGRMLTPDQFLSSNANIFDYIGAHGGVGLLGNYNG